jgi:DNA invertase Pin-like site-specific DNA recombinase
LKVALYIRTSTEHQEESIKLQTEELTRYCKLKDYEIYEKYTDFGFTGKNTDRPAFTHMMGDAKNHKFEMVLVTKIDRFARSILHCLTAINELQESSVLFAATSQPIDTSSSMGKLTLHIMAAFADFEREIIRERMETGRKAAEKRGVICNGPRKEVPKTKVLDHLDRGLSANAISKVLRLNVGTITCRLREWGYAYKNGQWVQKKEEIEAEN